MIIVNRDGEECLGRCLQSLGPPDAGLEVLLVDNASQDGSVGFVRREFPHVRVLAQERNIGFAAANNLAADSAEGEALLLLNADAWLEDGALAGLREVLDRDSRLGLAAPVLRYPDGGRQFSWSPARGVVGEFLQKLRNPFEASAWAHGRAARLVAGLVGRSWFTAACALVRAEAFRGVGGFDPRFFMYFEDVDLCIRLECAGWRLAQSPEAVANHAGGLARGAVDDDLYRPSQLLFYRLHRPRWEAQLVERRLRRRFGDRTVDLWASGGGGA
ncbi:MAG: glycosyltransferase family 2 protein [Thermoanaerobaculales bacterium]